MKKIYKFCLKSNNSVEDAIKKINETGTQIALILGDDKKLLGVLTDGDIRRLILNGNKLSTKLKSD